MKPRDHENALGTFDKPAGVPPKVGNLDIGALEQQKRDLQTEFKKVKAEIEAVKNDRIVRLGLCGVRGSGKSSLLAAWYLFREDHSDGKSKLLLRFRDDESIAYTKEVTEQILTFGSSKPTRMEKPINVVFDLLIDEEEWQVQTMDFTGGYVQLLSTLEEKQFAQPARDFLTKCDAIVCCHYWNDRSQETLDAINRVLDRVSSQFMLAITRLDEMGEVPQSKEDLDDALQGLQASSVYLRNLIADIRHISRRTGTVYAIAVCPLGGNFSDPSNPGKPLPVRLSVEDLNPIGTFWPLRLAVERKKKQEPRLQQRLLAVKSEYERVATHLMRAKEQKERQCQAQLKLLREDFAKVEERILRYLDGNRVPCYKDRDTLTEDAQRAAELGDAQLKKRCSQLQTRIEDVKHRAASRRRHFFELAALLIVAALVGIPFVWFAWQYVLEQQKKR